MNDNERIEYNRPSPVTTTINQSLLVIQWIWIFEYSTSSIFMCCPSIHAACLLIEMEIRVISIQAWFYTGDGGGQMTPDLGRKVKEGFIPRIEFLWEEILVIRIHGPFYIGTGGNCPQIQGGSEKGRRGVAPRITQLERPRDRMTGKGG